MRNRIELAERLQTLKVLYKIALRENDTDRMETLVEEIIRLNVVLKEEKVKRDLETIRKSQSDEIEFEVKEEEVIRQTTLVSSFTKKLKEIAVKFNGTTNASASVRQIETIMAGLRDRVGMEVNQKQIAFLNGLNINQANEIIKVLSGISFYNQRRTLTEAMEILKDRDDYDMILAEVRNNIHKREWFEHNKDLLAMSYELQEPTEAQIRTIANVAKYVETHETLKSEFGIEVRDFEYRQEDKLFYSFNWNLLKETIKSRFNRESAYNFIQTYEYITNRYEGNKLDNTQMNHLKNLYIQLGEYDCTRLTYLMTITVRDYDMIARQLENQVRLNKVANNKATQRFREALNEGKTFVKASARQSREVRSIVLKDEQQQAREFTAFIFDLYSCVGQDVPEEMSAILPYFVQGGEAKYATVEEQHYGLLRKMVFEQREVIKEVNREFNWGAFIANQPTHILKALGLDFMM